MKSEKKIFTLTDSEITSIKSVSRRSMLGALGLGAGAVTLVAGASTASASDPEGSGQRCPYRDGDSGDTIRRRCGSTDND